MSLCSSVVSDLEVFSHNPADGSFGPLAVQPSASSKCLNQTRRTVPRGPTTRYGYDASAPSIFRAS